jgi:CelD/BcsL family acetyltransferase involved in cellulose biosynthesis
MDKQLRKSIEKQLRKLERIIDAVGDKRLRQALDQHIVDALNILLKSKAGVEDGPARS